jgi:hypothetical protein
LGQSDISSTIWYSSNSWTAAKLYADAVSDVTNVPVGVLHLLFYGVSSPAEQAQGTAEALS